MELTHFFPYIASPRFPPSGGGTRRKPHGERKKKQKIKFEEKSAHLTLVLVF